ncbi:MAG: N-acyl-D-amino-acid deacylase family protein [bacterium]
MYSLLIKNGKIVDGTGNPWFYADIAIKGETIVRIGQIEGDPSGKTIDAKDLVICPGFIDQHSHTDLIFASDDPYRYLEGRIRQGITTEILGNCGISVTPVTHASKGLMKAVMGFMAPEDNPWNWETMADYLSLLEGKGVPVNVGTLTGHGAVRAVAMGFRSGRPTQEQLELMKRNLTETMEQGSFGMSLGLIYAPGMYADTKEIIELAKIVRKYNGIVTSHVRGSSETNLFAEKELIEIGEKSGCRVHRSHNEALGREHWDKIEKSLQMEEEARTRGIDIAYDMFPYTAAMTMMIAIYPPWALEGGFEGLRGRLKHLETRKQIEEDIEEMVPGWPTWKEGSWPHNLVKATGWENIYIGYIPGEKNKKYEGLSLKELGDRLRKSPFDAISDLLVDERGAISQLIFGVSGERETDGPLRQLISHRLGGFATDALDIGEGRPHPAAYGTYPRILGKYVREEKLLSLEEAVRKMTSFPASRLNLKGRGLVREGYFADLVIFDEARITDKATYENPRQFPEGVEHVIVNGQNIFERDSLHPIKAGKVLRGG